MTRRLLVADDEPHVARVLKVCLAGKGWEVEGAANGVEALARIAQRLPDVLITDINMPGMDGRELCRRVCAAHPQRPFAIFVMTSMTAHEERDWVRELGGIEFIEKPISPRQIAARLEQLPAKEPVHD